MLYIQLDKYLAVRMLSGRDVQPLRSFINETSEATKYWMPLLATLKTEEDCMQFIKHSLVLFSERRGVIAGLFYEEHLVGLISFNEIDQTKENASIGYILKEAYRGKGIMTVALRAFISYGFSTYRLREVELRIANNNDASIRLAKRLCFSYVQTIKNAEKLRGNYVAHDVYRIRREEWKAFY